MSAAVCSFPTIDGAVNTVIQTIQSGIPVARIELLDEVQMDAVNRYSKLDYPRQPTLFFEFHGTERGVREQAEMVQAIAAEHGGGDFQWATRPRSATGCGRRATTPIMPPWRCGPAPRRWATDVCVPISRLAECILETKRDIAERACSAPIVGHVGDGNFHLVFLIDRDDPEEIDERRAAQRAPGRCAPRDGRHLHRRARHRLRQDGVPRRPSTARPWP